MQAEGERAPDGRRLRWTEHRSQRRAGFVAAGAIAIDRFGPDASAEQIAETAGVSRTVLYRYFRDREDLRQAIADQLVANVINSVLPNLQITPTSTPREVIESMITVITDSITSRGVENTLADQVAALLKVFLMFFGIDDDKAEPGAYGLVGLVESTGAWWLSKRTMSREKLIDLLCEGAWALLEGTARANNVVVGYDDPLPVEAFTSGTS